MSTGPAQPASKLSELSPCHFNRFAIATIVAVSSLIFAGPIGVGQTTDLQDSSAPTAPPTAYVVTSSNGFGTIDLNTGTYAKIAQMAGLSGPLGGLGQVDGKLYGGAIRTGDLYEIDVLNGAATLVGNGKLSYWVTGSAKNALYAVGQDLNLYSIDTKNGIAKLIGPTGFDPATAGGGALSSGSETLYFSLVANGAPGATLYSLSTTTGAAKKIGFLGLGTGAPPIVFEGNKLYAGFNFPLQWVCMLESATGAPLRCLARASGVPGYFYGMAPAP